jgi:hypothetical protein
VRAQLLRYPPADGWSVSGLREVDQLEVVGDLIRHIENVDHKRRRRSIVEAPLQ